MASLSFTGGPAIILQARSFQPTHGQAYGPDLFPTIIGVGFVLAGIGLVISGWRVHHATGWVDVEGVSASRVIDALLLLVVIVAFILFANQLGFILTGGLGAWLLMVRFRCGHWLSSLVITAAVVMAVDWSFRAMLLVPLPQGRLLPALPW